MNTEQGASVGNEREFGKSDEHIKRGGPATARTLLPCGESGYHVLQMINAARLALKAMLVMAVIVWASCPAAAISIDAKAAVVMNSDGSVAYSKNHTAKLPPASTAKLVTAMVVLDRLKAEDMVSVSRGAARVESVKPKLKEGDEFTVEALLHLALMRSINPASVALAEETAGSEAEFVKLMNAKAASLGALDTHFINASGLPGKGQYTTAYDLTLIMAEALKYPLIKDILGKKYARLVTRQGRVVLVENSDMLLWASDSVIGGKSGYTVRAGHCFVGAMETEKGTIYACVLGSKTRKKLWQEMGSLMGLQEKPAPERKSRIPLGKNERAKRTARSKNIPAKTQTAQLEQPPAKATASK